MPPTFQARARTDRVTSRRSYDRDRDAAYAWRAWYKTSRWQKLRAEQLAAFPICVMCEARGISTSATICDHVERHGGDEQRFWDGPFQSLCKTCHDGDKQRLEHRRPGGSR